MLVETGLIRQKIRPGINLSLLPTAREVISRQHELTELRVLIMQHALRDTSHFLKLLRLHKVDVPCFFAKPNSVEQAAITSISDQGIEVIQEPQGVPPYSIYENTDVIPKVLAREVSAARETGRRLALLDVGGYFLKPLIELSEEFSSTIAGVVEVTTFGHNRYTANAAKFPYPIVSLARSPLKDA